MEKSNFGYSSKNIQKKLQTPLLREDRDAYQISAFESYVFCKQQQKSYWKMINKTGRAVI